MRIVRFQRDGGEPAYGVVEDGARIVPIEGDIFGELEWAGEGVSLEEVHLLAPVQPPNLLAIGRNYQEHAAESEVEVPHAPILFLKATSAVIGPEDPIVPPAVAPDEVDYEAELVVVIGRRARNVSEEEALDYVLGYTCGNDVSARDCQRGDAQWARGKSFDTFAPLGPWIETELDPGALRIQSRLNGETMQDASTSQLIFDVPYLVSYLSHNMTLLPGTAIMTGTPAGVGFARTPPAFLEPDDVIEVEIEGIGVLRNPVVSA